MGLHASAPQRGRSRPTPYKCNRESAAAAHLACLVLLLRRVVKRMPGRRHRRRGRLPHRRRRAVDACDSELSTARFRARRPRRHALEAVSTAFERTSCNTLDAARQHYSVLARLPASTSPPLPQTTPKAPLTCRLQRHHRRQLRQPPRRQVLHHEAERVCARPVGGQARHAAGRRLPEALERLLQLAAQPGADLGAGQAAEGARARRRADLTEGGAVG